MSAASKRKSGSVGVIDIFAGPGGLGEGFSSFSPKNSTLHPFQLAVSAEMEKSAHATLQLRAFVRLLQRAEGELPTVYRNYLQEFAYGNAALPGARFREGKWASLWREAEEEALNLTMGVDADNERLHQRIEAVREYYDQLVLIGGPPCQAYSVVGRARQSRISEFKAKGDHRHFLYKQYLGILANFTPDVFIMENVKGILTSKVGDQAMFEAIQRDLADPKAALGKGRGGTGERYVLLPIHVDGDSLRTHESVAEDPAGFLIRCEDHGVPQARHRIIIMGVREDRFSGRIERIPGLECPDKQTSVADALRGLPGLRSGISRQQDNAKDWKEAFEIQRRLLVQCVDDPKLKAELRTIEPKSRLPRSSVSYTTSVITGFEDKVRKGGQPAVLNHEARSHMPSDMGRYLFCAAFAQVHKRSPRGAEFPLALAPYHASWTTGAFSDRFRVQVRNRPSNTVTSHLSKDGHAFIHHDPGQCRSLTVREAARLQTFPDDYLFMGNRTQQFVQVGNAVPPMIARQIARVVSDIIKE
ncbi:DNA cytosine methyltransferase [Xanthomonas sp. CFBP 7698]|uniref:DNA cytosine methyltransferase n=1 Tax=Xanthomonas sp. CFBP 7698 TaxID=2082399 RepID=UPI000ECC36BB|nr:DNA cytosine methyltransferase [Xanthomonas sp. CFBP 7698]RJS02672.1 DNA (cytosine-5-)-methyltransferase [Xanthomonas sp. CFBP 7698]